MFLTDLVLPTNGRVSDVVGMCTDMLPQGLMALNAADPSKALSVSVFVGAEP
jgi:hypothetical protein